MPYELWVFLWLVETGGLPICEWAPNSSFNHFWWFFPWLHVLFYRVCMDQNCWILKGTLWKFLGCSLFIQLPPLCMDCDHLGLPGLSGPCLPPRDLLKPLASVSLSALHTGNPSKIKAVSFSGHSTHLVCFCPSGVAIHPYLIPRVRKVPVLYPLFVFLEVLGGTVHPVLVIVSQVEVEVLPLLLLIPQKQCPLDTLA